MAKVINQIKIGDIEYAIAASAYAEATALNGDNLESDWNASIVTDGDTTNSGFTLIKGVSLKVKFLLSTDGRIETLNVAGTGNKPVRFNGCALGCECFGEGDIAEFIYDGSYWNLVTEPRSLMVFYESEAGSNRLFTEITEAIASGRKVEYYIDWEGTQVQLTPFSTAYDPITLSTELPSASGLVKILVGHGSDGNVQILEIPTRVKITTSTPYIYTEIQNYLNLGCEVVLSDEGDSVENLLSLKTHGYDGRRYYFDFGAMDARSGAFGEFRVYDNNETTLYEYDISSKFAKVYTKFEVDNLSLITITDIDEIWNPTLSGCCFVSGTQVMVSLDGTTKSIETLNKGDTIVSYNIHTGENYEAVVNKLIINNNTTDIAEVHFDNGTILQMNAYHPIYTENGFHSITRYNGYDELVVGDNCRTVNGWSNITDIIRYETDPITTYNLDVVDNGENPDNEENDTFFANGVVVHNATTCPT